MADLAGVDVECGDDADVRGPVAAQVRVGYSGRAQGICPGCGNRLDEARGTVAYPRDGDGDRFTCHREPLSVVNVTVRHVKTF